MAACEWVMIPALREARSKLRAEVARHEAVLSQLGQTTTPRVVVVEEEPKEQQQVEQVQHEERDDEESLREDEQASDPPRAVEARLVTSAALQLAEEKLQKRPKTGYLRKAGRKGKWRFQLVEVEADSWLRYSGVGDDLSSAKPERVRLGPGARCAPAAEAATDSDVACMFVVQAGDHSSAWMAASVEERDDWIRSIRSATETAGASDATDFDAAIRRVATATCRDHFLEALGCETQPSRFAVPARWARSRLVEKDNERPSSWRGRFSPKPSPQLHKQLPPQDESFDQMRRDMRRDRVAIDDELVEADDDERHQAIATALATRLLSFNEPDDKLSEAGALVHACAVLVACTRTKTGGDAYACLRALCQAIDVVVCPVSTRATPLKLKVRRTTRERARQSSFCALDIAPELASPSGFAGRLLARCGVPTTPDERSAKTRQRCATFPLEAPHCPALDDDEESPSCLQVDAHATTAYRICTSNPQDLPSDTWAVVRAVWTQSFTISGEPSSSGATLTLSEPQVRLTIVASDDVDDVPDNDDDDASSLSSAVSRTPTLETPKTPPRHQDHPTLT